MSLTRVPPHKWFYGTFRWKPLLWRGSFVGSHGGKRSSQRQPAGWRCSDREQSNRLTCATGVGYSSAGQGGAVSTRYVLEVQPGIVPAQQTPWTLSSRDSWDAPLTFRRDFLSDSEMNLKWTVKRFLLMSFSVSHLLLLEGKSDTSRLL